MARAIMGGVKDYFAVATTGQLARLERAPKKHTIVSGETLSEIAQQYRVSLTSLRRTNGIKEIISE